MRKLNIFVSIAILILFVFHGIVGGYQLTGVLPGGSTTMKVLAYIMVGLVVLHMFIGIKLTVDTIKACKKTGTFYFRENILFFIRRITGFAVMLLIIAHMVIFMSTGSGAFRLHFFGGKEMVLSILLVICVALHVLSNIKPLFIGLGIKNGKYFLKDLLFVLSVIMLFCAVAYIIYYFRWNINWR